MQKFIPITLQIGMTYLDHDLHDLTKVNISDSHNKLVKMMSTPNY